VTSKELSNTALILLASERMQVDVCRAGQQVELFGRGHGREDALSLLDRGVTIFAAVDNQHGTPKQRDALDRT
jgi:rRNA processing protein Krr1/Pno1